MCYTHFMALVTSGPGAPIFLHFTSQFPLKIKTSRKVKLLVRFIDFSRHSLVVVNHKDIKKQNQHLLNIVMNIIQYIRSVLLHACVLYGTCKRVAVLAQRIYMFCTAIRNIISLSRNNFYFLSFSVRSVF